MSASAYPNRKIDPDTGWEYAIVDGTIIWTDPARHHRGRGIISEAKRIVADAANGHAPDETHRIRPRLVTASEFLYGGDDDKDEILHGRDSDVLHVAGEPTMVYAVTGAGKSTFDQNYAGHRLGIFEGDFIGYPVKPLGEGEAYLYVAADRPKQIRRSFRRLIGEDQAAKLDRRLVFHHGPLPFLINREPDRLIEFIREQEMMHDVVIRETTLDSLKDVALEIAKPDGGDAIARAFGLVVAEGIDLRVLHHERKPLVGAGKATPTIADVYGNSMMVNKMGNVIYLDGRPGAYAIRLHHLKQSSETVGPLELSHDHDSGRITADQPLDLLTVFRAAPRGMTVRTACLVWWGIQEPERNDLERARRTLEKWTKAGLAHRDGGGRGSGHEATYHPIDSRYGNHT